MAKCWTCGTSVSGYHYRCSSCKQALRELENMHDTISEGFGDLSRIQEHGFNQLSAQLSEIATVLEWGSGELSWQLQQQTDILSSIDHTLQTPSETKANEWRLHAEELRHRGVLEESEEFFLKALNEYRLDYRIYVGIAETYLQMNKFDKAKVYLEKSLPHAPEEEIDYKSYSYRLIGHIHICEEEYTKALEALHSSIKLSPDYIDGLYDFAQYMSLVSDAIVDHVCSQTFREWGHNWQRAVELRKYNLICHLALAKAIKAKPVYFYLAEKERNFERRREAVELALKNLLDNARGNLESIVVNTEATIEDLNILVSKAQKALARSREKDELESYRIYEDVKSKLTLARNKLASNNYIELFEEAREVSKIPALISMAETKTHAEYERYKEIRGEKSSNNRMTVIFLGPISLAIGGFIGGIVGSIYGFPLFFGIIGAVVVFIYVLYNELE